jgi:hypothetical protein
MSEAARRDHFPQVRVVRFCGEGGAGAEEGREEAAVGLFDCPVQRRVSVVIPRVDRGAVSEEQFCRLDVRIVSQTRLVKRRVIVVVAPVHVGTGFDQGGDDFSVAPASSEMERCALVLVRRMNIRSSFEKHA